MTSDQRDPRTTSVQRDVAQWIKTKWREATDRHAPSWPPDWLVGLAPIGAVLGGFILLGWCILPLVSGLAESVGGIAGDGWSWAIGADLTRVITEPVRFYLETNAVGLPASPQTLWLTWAVSGGILLVFSLIGSAGARIGWVLYGGLTIVAVWIGTAGPGRWTAAAVTVIAWSLFSMFALRWRSTGTPKMTVDATVKHADVTPAKPTRSGREHQVEPIDAEHARRQNKYLTRCDDLRQIWEDRLAKPGRLLAGALFTPFISRDGWIGHVQLVPGRHSYLDVQEARDAIAAAFEVEEQDQVVIEAGDSADVAFIRVFPRVSLADHYVRRPDLVITGDTYRDLKSWAQDYHQTWTDLRTEPHHRVNMARFEQRLRCLRGAIIDLRPGDRDGRLRDTLLDAGLSYESLPDDLADIAGLVPFNRGD